jgi:hypothetical protein
MRRLILPRGTLHVMTHRRWFHADRTLLVVTIISILSGTRLQTRQVVER